MNVCQPLPWIVAFAVTCLAGDARALGQESQSRQSEERRSIGVRAPILSALDRDRDGRISQEELANATLALTRLDKNRDGQLSRTEALGEARPANRAARSRRGGSRFGGYTTPPAANNVPEHLFDIILGRPTASSVTVSVLAYQDLEGYLTYGSASGSASGDGNGETKALQINQGKPVEWVIGNLQPNTRHTYQLRYRQPGEPEFRHGDGCWFHTQRSANSSFTFTLQADSHLDENTEAKVYERTLANALADEPDFHLALGDTFMTGKYIRPEYSLGQYVAQRYYFGRLCHSAPLFFVLGNHDGESGNRCGQADRGWATNTRKRYFPNPSPDTFYSGNDITEPAIGHAENYYAWHWGNSLFITLDPFRYTSSRSRDEDERWNRTLGEAQYQWLRKTLERSDARFKFIFIHHLVGGADRNGRGGVEAAPYFEWGGHNQDGSYAFDQKRPGWQMPIHELLVKHKATAVFHGHDHMFAKEELDGLVYQLVPQPGHPRFGNVRSAQAFGYVHGEVLSSSGHVRVRVSDDVARVDYVRAYLPQHETDSRRNGEVAFSYLMQSK